MPPLQVRVWRRHGQLRIYVSAGPDPVGWFDPRTGRSQLSQPQLDDEFWAAVRAECRGCQRTGTSRTRGFLPRRARSRLGGPQTRRTASPGPARHRPGSTGSGSTGWCGTLNGTDLARNMPGASASARARELRREHPLLTSAAAVLGVRTSAQQFAAGARGERTVGRQLDRWAARYGWHVLHAVPVGQRGADIDHVVIGPFGVVTVNTKTTGTAVWVGEYGLTVGGKPVNYLRQSRREASRAQPAAAAGDRSAGAGPVSHRLRRCPPDHHPPWRAARRGRAAHRPAPSAAGYASSRPRSSPLRWRPSTRRRAGPRAGRAGSRCAGLPVTPMSSRDGGLRW